MVLTLSLKGLLMVALNACLAHFKELDLGARIAQRHSRVYSQCLVAGRSSQTSESHIAVKPPVVLGPLCFDLGYAAILYLPTQSLDNVCERGLSALQLYCCDGAPGRYKVVDSSRA